MDETKNLFQTKTFWANLLAPLFIWLGVRYGISLDESTQAIIIAVAMSIVNIILRTFTTQPVTVLPAPK